MAEFGHEVALHSPGPRAFNWKEPAEDRILMEGAGEHLSGLPSISTPGHPYLKTSHAYQRRPADDGENAQSRALGLPAAGGAGKGEQLQAGTRGFAVQMEQGDEACGGNKPENHEGPVFAHK